MTVRRLYLRHRLKIDARNKKSIDSLESVLFQSFGANGETAFHISQSLICKVELK